MSDPSVIGSAKPRRSRTKEQPGATAKNDAYDFQTGSLGYALRRAQVRAYDMYYAMLSSLELSPARLTALSIIATQPEITQAILAQRLGITGATVVKMVDVLESAGLVVRQGCAGDRRKYVLELTAAGRAKLDEFGQHAPQYERRIAQHLNDQERAQLLSLLERVAVADDEC